MIFIISNYVQTCTFFRIGSLLWNTWVTIVECIIQMQDRDLSWISGIFNTAIPCTLNNFFFQKLVSVNTTSHASKSAEKTVPNEYEFLVKFFKTALMGELFNRKPHCVRICLSTMYIYNESNAPW